MEDEKGVAAFLAARDELERADERAAVLRDRLLAAAAVLGGWREAKVVNCDAALSFRAGASARFIVDASKYPSANEVAAAIAEAQHAEARAREAWYDLHPEARERFGRPTAPRG